MNPCSSTPFSSLFAPLFSQSVPHHLHLCWHKESLLILPTAAESSVIWTHCGLLSKSSHPAPHGHLRRKESPAHEVVFICIYLQDKFPGEQLGQKVHTFIIYRYHQTTSMKTEQFLFPSARRVRAPVSPKEGGCCCWIPHQETGSERSKASLRPLPLPTHSCVHSVLNA